MNPASMYCTFYLDDLLFGIEIGRVNEVFLNLPLTRVPLAPPIVEGLINLRGQILISINLRRLLLKDPKHTNRPDTNLVINTRQGSYCFLVDRSGEVIEVDRTKMELPLSTINDQFRSCVKFVYQFENQILHILDVDRILPC